MLLTILLSVFSFFTTADEHQFHLSRCLVEYNEQESALQISMHIFIDDLEEALRQQGADKLFICTEKEAPDAEKYMERYLNQQFTIQVEGQEVSYSFIGKEISEDLAAVWCYLEVTDVKSIKEIFIKNKILMEVFDDQKNIIHLKGPARQEGTLLFHQGKQEETVTF